MYNTNNSLNFPLCQKVEKMEAPVFFYEKFVQWIVRNIEKLQFAHAKILQTYNLGVRF